MKPLLLPAAQPRRSVVYLAGFLFSLHLSLTNYINSSFLAQNIHKELVGVVFSVAAGLAIIALLFTPSLIKKCGNVPFATAITFVTILILLSLVNVFEPWLAIGLFMMYYVLGLVIFYTIDLQLENLSEDKDTGGIRGTHLTVIHIAMMISLISAGLILGDGENYRLVYLVAAIALLPFWYITANFFSQIKIKDDRSSLLETTKLLWQQKNRREKDLAKILGIDFLVNFFFAFMLVYMPIYLHSHVGLSWTVIGWLFAFMLLPFVLFLIPLGRLADNYLGEKEIMTAGLIITGLATLAIGNYTAPEPIVWAGLLFTTRLGISAAETMKESYLFKHISSDDANILSLSRNTRPLAYIIAPLVASALLIFFEFQFLFTFLGGVMILGLWFSLGILDTK